MIIKKKNNFLIKNFSTKPNLKKVSNSKKFLELQLSKNFNTTNFLSKIHLLYGMTYNTIFFCFKYWDLSYTSNFIKPVIVNLNSNLNLIWKSTLDFFSKFFFSNWLKWNFFFSIYNKFLKTLIHPFKTNIFLLEKFLKLKIKQKIINKKINFQSDNHYKTSKNKINKKIDIINQKKLPVKAFLFAWATKNNFFTSIVDNNGNTLVSWTGGNSEWTGSWQRATVFSADSAMYEVCFLGWERGVESLSIHIKSTLRLPQIKNSFDGLEAAGLKIDEVVYRPLKSFGGCRSKKPWRV